MARSNQSGIRKYLARFDIDPDRIPSDSVTDEGYDYFPAQDDPQARTHYDINRGFSVPRTRYTWPEGFEIEVLRALIGGAKDDVIPEDKPKVEPEQKQETPKTTRSRAKANSGE
jgi:hypothetical protein